ncbi:MAG: hypothetical protein EBU52_21675, partial [Cytophagia bacterium]|nr:hypothetical protein [Cytophagia bacterium]
ISKNTNGGDLFISPLANLSTGKRRVIDVNNAGYGLTKTLNDLPAGRYYWSVQAIDQGKAGSAFAAEQTFSICDPINLGADKTICENDALTLTIGSGSDVVNWYSKSNGLLQANTFSYTFNVTATDTIVAELTKSFGCTVKDTLIVTMSPLPEVDLGNDISLCYNESTAFQLPVVLDSVNWLSVNEILLTNSRNYSHIALSKDTVIAQVYSAFRCVAVDSVIIDVLPLPVFTLGADLTSCEKEIVDLSVPGTWTAVNWRVAGGSPLATNSPTLSYQVLETKTILIISSHCMIKGEGFG